VLTGRLVDSSTDGGLGGVEHDASSSAVMALQLAVRVVLMAWSMVGVTY
jgi:hypothetical protein